MIRKLTIALAAASFAFTAAPAISQDNEQPRTTYSIEFLRFAPDKADTWTEMNDKYWAPAAKNAGLKPAQVHWLMDGEWDLMVVREIPRGLAAFDTHASPERAAWQAEFLKLVGGEEAAKKMREEQGQLIDASMRFFSHTHP
ncbi:MAG TPA: hypothetical protein VK839_01885 [Erythrobacter sp.]|nr:hypothetical protein [Erythrobacter sp.]